METNEINTAENTDVYANARVIAKPIHDLAHAFTVARKLDDAGYEWCINSPAFAELCRKANVSPSTFTDTWQEIKAERAKLAALGMTNTQIDEKVSQVNAAESEVKI